MAFSSTPTQPQGSTPVQSPPSSQPQSAPAQSTPSSFYAPEVEASSLANLLRHGGEVWAEYHLNDRDDYSVAHRPLWDIIKAQLDQTPPGSLDPLLLSTKLSGMGITSLEGGFAVFDYLDGLRTRFVAKEEAPNYARELKRLRVRRDLVTKLDSARRELLSKPNATFEEMTGLVERGLTAVTTEYHKPEVTEVWGNLIEVVEKRAAKPLKAEEAGFLGPFRSLNETIGPLCYHGSYTVVGARSSVGKSSIGWHYQTYLLEHYPQTHLLHLDAAEMTFEELCWRAVCAMSEGKIPYHAVYRGEWEKNREWRDLIRGKLWPRARKMVGRMSFKNVGGMSPKERITFLRRYYYQKVGRGNHLLIHDDYLKGQEAMGKNTAEHQAMGFYVGDQKTLITDEIMASVWTSVQQNRSGETGGKKEGEINDSSDTFSLSDRILQQSTHSFVMRPKTEAELAREMNLFGNLVFKPAKKRQLLGERFQEMIAPVKVGTRFVQNAYNLQSKGFWYQDCGTLREMVERLGQAAVKVDDGQSKPAAGL